jgi:hypothetical protein
MGNDEETEREAVGQKTEREAVNGGKGGGNPSNLPAPAISIRPESLCTRARGSTERAWPSLARAGQGELEGKERRAATGGEEEGEEKGAELRRPVPGLGAAGQERKCAAAGGGWVRFRFCRHYIPWQHDLSRRLVEERLKRDGPCKLSPKTAQKLVFWPI